MTRQTEKQQVVITTGSYSKEQLVGAITKLMELVKDTSIDTNTKLTLVCESIDKVVPNANRVSLWRFNEQQDELECLQVLDPQNGSEVGPNIRQGDFPDYFNHIVNNKVVVAADAREHYLTKSFKEAYLEPLDVYSLLDFVVRKDKKAVGIICCERVGAPTKWDKIDKIAVKRVANILPALYQSEH